MKNTYKLYLLIVIMVISFGSCETVGGLDDVEINGNIAKDQVYKDPALIELAVIGSYATVRNIQTIAAPLSGLSISGQLSTFGGGDESEVVANNVVSSNSIFLAVYTGAYRTLVNANELIVNVPGSVLSPENQLRVLGETKFIRALAHFYLLRTYGQFYDLNSEYGIILGPVAGDALPRNTVQEVYNAILADLDDAIASGIPESGDASRATVNGAKALKAKVLLYMNRYAEAAALSGEFLSLELADSYEDIFVKAHESSDVLFASPTDFDDSNRRGGGYTFGIVPGSEPLQQLHATENDTIRVSTTSIFESELTGFKWTHDHANPPAWMHLRIPEIWLIYAEAQTRKIKADGGSVADISEAIDQLNKIRARVNLTPKNPTSLDEFLEMVRQEKLMELYYENGEDWFDLIRYHLAGDLDITTIKSSVTNVDQFIMPLPFNEIDLGGGVIKQNPGYE